MEELKLPKINNEIKITQEEWDKFQKDLELEKLKLQKVNDNLKGGLTPQNIASFRNTYVITIQDSLDASYPMLVPFDILDGMIKIVKIEVSFRILPYRGYVTTPTAADDGGAAHTHALTYGIYEETNSPSIKFSISEDNGITYGDIVGTYTEDKLNIDISSLIDTVGIKILKFESTARARLNIQVTIKIDIKAR